MEVNKELTLSEIFGSLMDYLNNWFMGKFTGINDSIHNITTLDILNIFLYLILPLLTLYKAYQSYILDKKLKQL